MSFKRGFLKKANQPGSDQKSTSNDDTTFSSLKDLDPSLPAVSPVNRTETIQKPAVTTPKKISDQLYQLPTSYSTVPQAGQDAPIQLFRGTYDNPTRQSPGLLHVDEYLIKGGGPHVLLNLDLGPNAKQTDKIPMWTYPDSLPMVNAIVGKAKPGAQWGTIKPLPDLGGENGSGKGVRWVVKEVENKGMGLVSLQKLNAGDVVVCERPILVAPTAIPGLPGLGRHKFYEALYNRQSEEQKKAYFELYNSKDESLSKFEGIVRTNQAIIEPITNIKEHYAGLFPIISRANHSCGPNATWHFNLETFSLDLHVVRTVQPGEEITASYGPFLEPKHERQRELEEKYQFICQCHICNLDITKSAQSERRRKDLLNWESNHPTIKQWQTDSSYGKLEFVENQKRRIVTCNVEGLQELTRTLLVDLLLAYVILGDAEGVKKFGSQTLTMMKATKGEGSEGMTDIETIIQNPQSYPNWKTLNLRDLDYLPKDKGKGKSKPIDLEDMMRKMMPAELMAKVDAAEGIEGKNAELLKILSALSVENGPTGDSALVNKFIAGTPKGTPSTKQLRKK